MAPDISSDALMVDLIRMRDDNRDEGNDPTRRVARLSKGKSVKQSTDIRQDKEHISHKRFEDRSCNSQGNGISSTQKVTFTSDPRCSTTINRPTNRAKS